VKNPGAGGKPKDFQLTREKRLSAKKTTMRPLKTIGGAGGGGWGGGGGGGRVGRGGGGGGGGWGAGGGGGGGRRNINSVIKTAPL